MGGAGGFILDKSIRPSPSRILVLVRGFCIGFMKNELVNNLRIAMSGTKASLVAMSAGGVISMAGQFGFCFLSSYLGLDKVRVDSKNNDDEQFIWESAAGVSFTVQNDTEMVHREVKHGTKITCYLKKSSPSSCRNDA